MIALRPLATLYRTIVAGKNTLYDRGVLKAERLSAPVVSIGNITTGGSGKTPFVIALARLLHMQGHACDVLSRGYGRDSRGVLRVDPNGTAEEFGDEPLLIARTGTPVYVGEGRCDAGRRAEAELGLERIHLLDDGFQHRRLHRDLDIVLLSPDDLRDHLLPEGRLREAISALSRADVLAIEREMQVPEIARSKRIWRYSRTVEVAHSFERPLAFCGIARPERFFDAVRHSGSKPVFAWSFGDHHRYSERDCDQLLRFRDQHHSDGFLTTEKDFVRLSSAQLARLQPVTAVPLTIELAEPEQVLAAIFSTIAARRGRS